MRWIAIAALLLLAAAVAMAQESAMPAAARDAAAALVEAASLCPYCRAARTSDDFCPQCGRLAGMDPTGAASRFWGDAPYVLPFPARESAPSIASQLSDMGIAQETVTFLSGDRYTMIAGKRGPRIEGKVNFGATAKEASLKAKMEDTMLEGRLVEREIHGEVSGETGYHLYRKLDYVYAADGLLDAIRFGTWFYSGGSDREKRPGSWLRHAVGEIALVRELGRLSRIETSYREGRRSLRGEPGYADPVITVESVQRAASGAIVRLIPTSK